MKQNFSLYFTAKECNGWPKAKFLIDAEEILENLFSDSQEKINLSLDLDPGLHTLEIVKYGKTNLNCIVEKDKIVQDQVLALDKMTYDNITVPTSLLYRGTWVWEQTQHGSLTWGPNGTWVWQFEVPFVPWAAKTLRNQGHPHKNLLDPWHEIDADFLQDTMTALNLLEKTIIEQSN